MTHFERTEGAEDNLGKNPEFKDLEDEIALDENPIPGEEVEEIQDGAMYGDHSEDGLEPEPEWKKSLESEGIEIQQSGETQTLGDKFDDLADDIQKYHDQEISEDEARKLHERDLAKLKDRTDRGIKDYSRDTIRGEENAA